MLGKYPNQSLSAQLEKVGILILLFFLHGIASLTLKLFGNRIVPDYVRLGFAGIRPRSQLEDLGTTGAGVDGVIKRVKCFNIFNIAFLNAFP